LIHLQGLDGTQRIFLILDDFTKFFFYGRITQKIPDGVLSDIMTRYRLPILTKGADEDEDEDDDDDDDDDDDA